MTFWNREHSEQEGVLYPADSVFGLLFGPIGLIALGIWWSKTRPPVGRAVFGAFFVFYLAAMFTMTFAPIYVDGLEYLRTEEALTGNLNAGHNFVPFASIVEILKNQTLSVALRQIGGNLVLMFPLGFAMTVGGRSVKALKTVAVAVAVSFGIETIQLLGSQAYGFNWKSVDVDDVILNTAGALVGWTIGKLFERSVGSGALEVFRTPE